MSFRFGSVCSGIEAASVAWGSVWEAAWFSEIEPFPCAVLAYRFPNVPNHGDMTTLPARILSGEVEAPDLLCGGTPCQAFSVAGKRLSLDDDRGNLSLIFCRIADAIDSVRAIQRRRPSIVFWENVPGVLSTKDNAFGCFLAELVGADFPLQSGTKGWPSSGYVAGPKRRAAWRVLDAQYFGVPQRRRRVFVIASSREGFDPSEVLFERPSLHGNSAPRRTAGQGASSYTESSFGAFRGSDGLSGTLKASGGVLGGGSETVIVEPSVYDMTHANDVVRESKEVPTLQARMGTGGNQIPLVLDQAKKEPCYCLAENTIGRRPETGGNGTGVSEEVSFTLNATGVHGVAKGQRVRRLTPVECERLQGFPDNWTKIPYRGKSAEECPDSPRYKAIGNSWAVPCAEWIGKRIIENL